MSRGKRQLEIRDSNPELVEGQSSLVFSSSCAFIVLVPCLLASKGRSSRACPERSLGILVPYLQARNGRPSFLHRPSCPSVPNFSMNRLRHENMIRIIFEAGFGLPARNNGRFCQLISSLQAVIRTSPSFYFQPRFYRPSASEPERGGTIVLRYFH